MRVVEASSLELGDGTWVRPEVELDSADFEKAMAEWGVEEDQLHLVPLFLRYEVLSVLARVLIAQRLVESARDDVSKEHWVKEVGKPMLQAAGQAMQATFQKVHEAIK